MEFFGNLSEQERRQVWGATFQTSDKTRNLVGDVPMEFDALIERLNERTDRPAAGGACAQYPRSLCSAFPTQMAALKRPVFDFLNQIFEPTRYHANATLRGFYFTSGTQQGTPIDQLIGAIAKSFGAEEVGAAAYSGVGKSFFLTDLIRKVVIGEAAWVSTDRAAIRRSRILKTAAYAGLFLLTAGAAGAWVTSYDRNRNLITQTDNAVADYRAAAGPLAKESRISDRDFAKVLPALHKLRYLPAGYGFADKPSPAALDLRPESSANGCARPPRPTYHIALERMFRSRLLYRLEEVLTKHRDDPSYIYEALKVYLMLGGQYRTDPALIESWARNDWAQNLYPGPGNKDGRDELAQHLKAMLDLAEGEQPSIGLNGPLVADLQNRLARLSVADRAYQLLKSQARASTTPDWVAAQQGGSDFAQVFTTADGSPLDTVRVPGFFTYLGFQRDFMARLADIGEQVKKDRWVLGRAGTQSAIDVQYSTLDQSLLELYTKDFIATWRRVLNRLQLRPLTAGKPQYDALVAVSAATSPLKQLVESVARQTNLTRPPTKQEELLIGEKKQPESGKGGLATAALTSTSATAPALIKEQGQAPGTRVATAFKPFQTIIDKSAGRPPIDDVVANLAAIRESLFQQNDPLQAAQGRASMARQLTQLQSTALRLPAPFSSLLLKAAGVFQGDLTNSSRVQLQRALEPISQVCRQIVPNRYPFDRSDREVPLVDFARLFAPNGLFDAFFKKNLEPLVDKGKSNWSWRKDIPLGRTLQQATLTEFQRAEEIKDAFFASGGNLPSFTLTVIPPAVSRLRSQARDQRHDRREQANGQCARGRALAGSRQHQPNGHLGRGEGTGPLR